MTKIKNEDRQLVYSAIQTPDGTIIESNHRHDYKTYLDKNGKEYMIDGGLDYIRSSANGDEKYISVYSDEPHEKVREFAFRTGYGKTGKEEFRVTRIKDMDDDYLLAAIVYLENLNNTNNNHYKILLNEKEFRKL